MGYFDKLEDESLAIKKVAELVFKAGRFQGSFKQFWPDRNDSGKKERKVITKELYETIKKIHNIK